MAGIANDAALNKPLESQRNFRMRAVKVSSTSSSRSTGAEPMTNFQVWARSFQIRARMEAPGVSTGAGGTETGSVTVAIRRADVRRGPSTCRVDYRV